MLVFRVFNQLLANFRTLFIHQKIRQIALFIFQISRSEIGALPPNEILAIKNVSCVWVFLNFQALKIRLETSMHGSKTSKMFLDKSSLLAKSQWKNLTQNKISSIFRREY